RWLRRPGSGCQAVRRKPPQGKGAWIDTLPNETLNDILPDMLSEGHVCSWRIDVLAFIADLGMPGPTASSLALVSPRRFRWCHSLKKCCRDHCVANGYSRCAGAKPGAAQ